MAQPESVYQAILKFSGKQPPWVQDALRRIATGAKLTQSDLDDAVAMCKAAHGLSAPGAPPPLPLAASHLPTSASAGAPAVTLVKLHDLVNVNALLAGQTLAFSPSGITIVYGTNGAGKSGYARVLKRLCRARGGVAPILPNVFAQSPGSPKASIAFAVAGTEHTWTGDLDAAGPTPPDPLAEVTVYDGVAGAHTVEAAQEVTLLPPGLDLLPALKDVLEHVAQALKSEDANEAKISAPTAHPGTPSSAFLQKLSSKTTAVELDAACSWTEDDEATRLQAATSVAELAANDPQVLAGRARKRAEQIDRLAAALERTEKELSDGVVSLVEQRLCNLTDARDAVALHGSGLLPVDVLPGTGGGAWRVMWEAARAYSQGHAYPGHDFPHTDDAARCVLCQQALDADAIARLQKFEEFVAGVLSNKLKLAETEIADSVQRISRAIDHGLLDGTYIEVLDDLKSGDSTAVKDYVASARLRRDALTSRLGPDGGDSEIPSLSGAPTDGLKVLAAAEREQAEKLEATSAEAAMAQAVSTLNVLEDRKLLHAARPLLEAEAARQKRVERRKAALKDCGTKPISVLLGALTQTHVTGALATAFNTELAALGGKHLAVEVIKTQTSKATTYTALALKNAAHNQAVVRSVFSEGEQRAVSLAWFFAELTLSPTSSTIVFDDPVSSLDHDWRRRVAGRLAAAACERQVIVFTHDAVFLHMLHRAAEAAGAAPSSLQVQRSGGAPGYCSNDVPWEKKNVKQRVAALKNEHVALKKTKKTGSDDDYAQAVVGYLDRLRKTWERAVEECLFNGVIERFDYGVKTQSIAQVDVLPTDYAAIDGGMSTCSAWVHDPAQGLLDPPPSPDEVAGMVNDLIAWVAELRDRRPKPPSLPKLDPIPL